MVRSLRVALCTLCLNEQEFLDVSYEQHKDWPSLVSWTFVEGADRKYAEANPALVSPEGLSTDGTSDWLYRAVQQDPRITYNPYGWMVDANAAQSKTKGRDRYLDRLEEVRPDFFVVLDADEFYTKQDQQAINDLVLETWDSSHLCWRLTQRHIWYPPSLQGTYPLRFEVVGGYWGVRHVRVFRWCPGIRYRVDHNWPCSKTYRPRSHMYDGVEGDPQCIHLGFARDEKRRKATNAYYRARGEGQGDGRNQYVRCRAAWESWVPGKRLPNGARVINYTGPIPDFMPPAPRD